MDKPIEVGKWAVVHLPYRCCGQVSKRFGIPFIVQSITVFPNSGGCPFCKQIDTALDARTAIGTGFSPGAKAPLYVVKRLDDPDVAEPTTQEEAEKEPA